MEAAGPAFRYPLDEIREKTDIVELISTYVNLKRSGKTLKAVCPFHTEKDASFTVNEDLQRWHCFGCHEHGDIFTFLMKIENMTFPEAVQELAKRAGITIQRSPEQAKSASDREKLLHINTLAASYFARTLRETPSAMAYLEKRGVSPDAISKYGLGYAPAEWRSLLDFLASKKIDAQAAEKAGLAVKSDKGTGYYDRFRDRLIFPIQDTYGRVIAFGGRALGDDEPKYLNSPETPAFVKNKTLYGLNHARKAITQEDRAIVVEGYLDALTAQCAGFANTVATMGTSLTPEHVKLLSRYTHNAALAFDSDSAGMAAALRSAPMFEQAGFDIRVASMPAGEDPDSLLRSGRSATFGELIGEAPRLVEYRLKLLKEGSDLTTTGGKVEMLKKAAAILSQVPSAVERDQYIRQLAEYHPNFASGTSHAEEHIRRDVESRMPRRGRPAVGQQPATAEGENGKVAPTALTMAERCILKAIIADSGWANRIFVELPPDRFTTSEGKMLASAIAERLSEGDGIDWNKLSEAVSGTDAERLLSELTVEESGPDSSEQAVKDCIGKLNRHWKSLRMKELATLVEKGKIHSGSEEFSEYWRLVQELHNKI